MRAPRNAPTRHQFDVIHPPGSRSGHLSVSGISHAYGDRRVLSDISFTAAPGDKVGLIGENGSGKSTLLRIIVGLETPDSGSVTHAAPFGALAQELPYDNSVAIERVLDEAQRDALDALLEIEQAAQALAEPAFRESNGTTAADPATRYATALERAECIGAWSAAAQRGSVLDGLGLGTKPEHTRVGDLSGGERARLGLAALLLSAPHTLILDEPSNHLDDDAMGYLESALATWPGIVLVASHDRVLLDAVTTRILDLDPSPIPAAVVDAPLEDPGYGLNVTVWGMGYSQMRVERARLMQRWRDQYAAEVAERAALVHEIDVGSREVNRKHESKSEAKITRKYYADKDARVTARRARNARVRLAQLERVRLRRPPDPLEFRGVEPGRVSNDPGESRPVLRASDVGVEGRLAPTSLTLAPSGRLLLTGPNGAGKSTLLAVLSGSLSPSTGHVARRYRVGFLPQEVTFAQPQQTAAEAFARAVGAATSAQTDLTELGLLSARDAHQPLDALSVGQRRRVALGILLADPPPILLLDEPTNHLSLALAEELEASLRDFAGAVIVASHDRWWRSNWNGEVLPLTRPTMFG